MGAEPSAGEPAGWPSRWRKALAHVPTIEALRIGAGIVWLVNLLFIVDPANDYWGSFAHTARSFAPTTIGGPGLAQYVAAHPTLFAWGIALLTGYLAVAFLIGLTTRAACLLGSFFSAMLLATQFGSTFLFPGGTDVGAHPLYILIYIALILGGAGRAFSADHLLRSYWVQRRHRRAPSGVAVPHPWATAVSPRVLFVYAVAGIVLSFAVGIGLVVTLPVAETPGGGGYVGTVHYVNLTVDINTTNGWPQYSPANFSVPTGRTVFTIVDNDSPMNWSACVCTVRGTVGGTELLNGSTVAAVPSTNVAHTFEIPSLGLRILSPGLTTIQFTVDLFGPGNYTWYCLAPCGQGANPYASGPMGVPGFMTGTLTVT